MSGAGWIWNLDGWIVVAAMLSAMASSLLGTYLVLRRMSLLGDAISHAVLPGLAMAFLLSGTRHSWAMFAGAVIIGLLTAIMTQWIREHGRVDESASMGVVFTTLFALGLVLIVQAADRVDLDANCVLYGAIELTPLDTWKVMGLQVPRVVVILGCVCLLNGIFVVGMYKELKIASFDPALATTCGFSAQGIHYLLMVLIAITTVASFESVGNIIVIAMMIVPPATACLLSERLDRVLISSVLLAMGAAALGHLLAITLPIWLGWKSTSTSGMIAVVSGLLFGLTMLLSPRHGIVMVWLRRRWLTLQILTDDLLAALFRSEEQGKASLSQDQLCDLLFCRRSQLNWVQWWQARRGLIQPLGAGIALTPRGRSRGQQLVRSHRLWETYLVDQAGVGVDRIHAQAEKLEHFTDDQLRKELNEAGASPTIDPHGREIPANPSPPSDG
jgi:manganese/zinc/iron transport system permease protein